MLENQFPNDGKIEIEGEMEKLITLDATVHDSTLRFKYLLSV